MQILKVKMLIFLHTAQFYKKLNSSIKRLIVFNGFILLIYVYWTKIKNIEMLKKVVVQGPGYTKQPLGCRVAYSTLIKTIMR